MHILQPKHLKLKEEEVEKILKKFNISRSQLPKISLDDPALPESCKVGDVIKIEREDKEEKFEYFRVIV